MEISCLSRRSAGASEAFVRPFFSSRYVGYFEVATSHTEITTLNTRPHSSTLWHWGDLGPTLRLGVRFCHGTRLSCRARLD